MVFTTPDNSFEATEISYLGYRLCKLAVEAKLYDVENSNDTTQGNITEEKESELEEFIDYAKIVMGTFRHKIFDPVISIPISPIVDSDNIKEEEPMLLKPENPMLWAVQQIKALLPLKVV